MDAFAALADPTRRRLLERMAAGTARVVDLATGLPISRPAVSKHLRLLGEAGLVVAEPHGRETHYTLKVAALAPVTAFIEGLRPRPPVAGHLLDGLDLEVRRTANERRHHFAGTRPLSVHTYHAGADTEPPTEQDRTA